MDGWIKIHRKIAKWEWYKDSTIVHLFFHLLLHANYEKGRWQGIDIVPGQIVTGRHSLALQTGISERSIRTSLNKLKATNEVTIKTSNKYSIITIVNWADYQDSDQHLGQQTTSNRPASDQQVTTIEEGKKERRIRKKEYISTEIIKKSSVPEIVAFDEFKLYREQLKKPLTKLGADKLWARLIKLNEEGYDVIELLETAMERGWLSVYPPKDDTPQRGFL